MCGDPCDSMTEQKMIDYDGWDQEPEDTVREYVLQHMLRKVTYSAANGHLRVGGGYLTVEEYAEAMTNRVMKARKKRHNG